MRLAVVSALAALAAGPLAAQAAAPPARWSATLNGTVADTFEYVKGGVEGRCRISRKGSSGRQLALQSIRATRIQVQRRAGGVTFRPSRLGAVRVTGGTTGGSALETKLCPGELGETRKIDCEAARSAPRLASPGFRARRKSIAFNRAVPAVSVCGLDERQAGGWLHLAPAPADLDALVSGRSRRVVVRARATVRTQTGGPALLVTRTSTVRWTLTFTRR